MRKIYLPAQLLLFGLLMGCASSSFIKTGLNQQYDAKPSNCTIDMVTVLPERELIEVGICFGESFNELRDRIEHSYEKLRECACNNGGDLILVDSEIMKKGSGITVKGTVFRYTRK